MAFKKYKIRTDNELALVGDQKARELLVLAENHCASDQITVV